MSDQKKQSGLSDLINTITAGAASLTAGRKKKGAEPGPESEPPLTEPQDRGSDLRATIDDLEDPLHLDEQDQQAPPSPAKKQMSTRKKVVLVAAVVCAAVLAKNGVFAPSPELINPPGDNKSASNSQPEDGQPSLPNMAENGLATGLNSVQGGSAHADPDVGQTLDELALDGPFQKPIMSQDQNERPSDMPPPPGDGFGFPTPPSNVSPPPLEIGKTDPKEPNRGDLTSPFGGVPQTEAPAAPAAPAASEQNSLFGTLSAQPTQVPIAQVPDTEKRDPVLGSASIKNPDSGQQPSLQSNTDELKKMEEQLAKKDGEIKSLKAQLASKQHAQPVRAKPAAAHSQKQSIVVAQRPQPRSTKPVAKVAPRPKLCVKAVAPPARNCPTCVAHAFVVDTGAESMVGQGDFLAGYRVSITGDRLDLQNSDGHVVHKFWSQPNGCPSI
ncbi:hypothetical protein [Pseudomonas mosselii]|uniref:hypothetical protein n=1 Tax=Pseudomonas mosselii TaxID=78327 RepID=UPI0021DB6F6B|nr:hypothetical protein [Pseudomonas mosselii]MCU9527585.1 hypothetical protein [Pseudomonas mosselii]MCU9534898.1 hypothetical protein [Pseudomonas mosselii]MCU9542401.1 hypothetical protein [Pseudomonas mosselii]MCU9546738.1 hypothetical protein [Pseudomonas mosselii]